MTSRIRTCLVLAGMMLVLPPVVLAQEVLLTGTITDTTGAVLPGLTVQATHESSGNTFETVTAAASVRCEMVPAICTWHRWPMPAAARPCSNRHISRSPLDWSPDGRFLCTSTTTRRRPAAISENFGSSAEWRL